MLSAPVVIKPRTLFLNAIDLMEEAGVGVEDGYCRPGVHVPSLVPGVPIPIELAQSSFDSFTLFDEETPHCCIREPGVHQIPLVLVLPIKGVKCYGTGGVDYGTRNYWAPYWIRGLLVHFEHERPDPDWYREATWIETLCAYCQNRRYGSFQCYDSDWARSTVLKCHTGRVEATINHDCYNNAAMQMNPPRGAFHHRFYVERGMAPNAPIGLQQVK